MLMKPINQFLTIYLLIMNLLALLAMGLDKRRAIRNGWRIPEKSLLLIGSLGGAAGLFLGSKAFHHKTQKPLFKFGIPILLILNGIIIYLLLSA